jgi:hypothetical protein
MKIGTRVRLVGVPGDLPSTPGLPTNAVFVKCVGHEFLVAGLNDLGMAELVVESVTNRAGETIWVEPEFLEVLD